MFTGTARKTYACRELPTPSLKPMDLPVHPVNDWLTTTTGRTLTWPLPDLLYIRVFFFFCNGSYSVTKLTHTDCNCLPKPTGNRSNCGILKPKSNHHAFQVLATQIPQKTSSLPALTLNCMTFS